MSGRARDSHARGREFKSQGRLHPSGRTIILQYLETRVETGGFMIYCEPRHKGSLILLQDSVDGVLKDRSHYVLGSTSEEEGQYRCRLNQEQVTE